MPPPPIAVFDALPDPRRDAEDKPHLLTGIPTITIRAAIGGAEARGAIAEFGRIEGAASRRPLRPGDGIPSADTLGRVFAKPGPVAFARAFGRWMAAAREATGSIPVAIGGESARGA